MWRLEKGDELQMSSKDKRDYLKEEIDGIRSCL